MQTFRSARLMVLDPEDRLLLFRYADGLRSPFWATAGGRVLDGESYLEAAARELREETGFTAPIGPFLRERTAVYAVAGTGPARWIEHYFLVRSPGGVLDRGGWTDEERSTIQEHRWWTLAELRVAADPVLPELFAAALASGVDSLTR